MTAWRPAQLIKVKALGLVWRNNRLLASEIYHDDGSIKGVRPLGGQLEFGETWREALVREFHEELGVDITVTGQPLVFENIYEHHGVAGHEIVFVADVTFPDNAYPRDDPIEYREDNGEICRASWFDPADLDKGGLALFPNGLKARLSNRNQPKG